MLEALETLLKTLAESKTLQTLQAIINPQNKASLQLALKLGFKQGRQLEDVKDPYQCYFLDLRDSL